LEVKASHALVVKDLQLLHKTFSTLKSIVRTPELIPNHSVAESLQVLLEDVKIVSTTQASTNAIVDSAVKSNQEFRQTIIEAVEENEGQFIAAVQEFKAMKDQLTQINSLINEHEKRFSILFPIIREFKRGPNATQSNTSLELNALQTRIESL